MVITAEEGSGTPDRKAAEPTVGGDSLSYLLKKASSPVPKTCGSKKLLAFLNVNGKGEVVKNDCRSMVDAPRKRARVPEEEVVAEGEGDDSEFEEKVRAKLMVEGERRMQAPDEGDEEEEEEEVVDGEGEDGAREEVRAKLMVHLRQAADRLQLALDPTRGREAETKQQPIPSSVGTDASMPWKLRTRTAVRRVIRYGFEPDVADCDGPAKPVRQRSWNADRGERSQFSISLSTQEIAEDIYAVTGCLPRRRPRRRARLLQKQIDALFPGSWLTEITADLYKVPG